MTIDHSEPVAGRPLEQDAWQAVSPHYKTALRIRLLLVAAIVFALVLMANYFEPVPARWVSLPLVLCFAYFTLVWIPRRARFTRYLLRELDVHLQTGYWWRKTTSVAINRIQHLELTQGPIERWLTLNSLVLYTAGGSQSDLKLPGLDAAVAQHIKAQLLNQIAEEDIITEDTRNGADA